MPVKKLSILLTLCVAAAGVTLVVASRRSEIPEMTLRALSGTVSLVRDGDETTVDGDQSLKPGDVIETHRSSSAQLKLRGEREAWLQSDTEVLVTDETSLSGIRGKLRSRAIAAEMVIEFDGIEAYTSDAHFRIDQRAGAARVGTYDGEVRLSKPGEPRLTVGRLFEAEIPAADLPTESRPYRYKRADEWDRSILEDVMRLDDKLTQQGEGLASQIGDQRPGLDYFRALADRKVSFMRGFLKRPAQELLIGFVVARNSSAEPLARSFRTSMSYRDDGGRWGVIASIMEAEQETLIADLQSVIVATGAGGGDGAEPEFTVATASQADAPGATSGGEVLGGTESPGGGGGGKGGGPKDDDPGDDCTEGVDCTLKDVQDQLPNPNPSPSPSPTDDPGKSLTGGILGGDS
jgi:hypothetical protein